MLLKWSDIYWETDRLTVTSSKTRRYGKPIRVVPLFSDRGSALDEVFAMAEEGEQWVIPMLCGLRANNLSTSLKKIIRHAGVEAWSKRFQNMRASRQTELEKKMSHLRGLQVARQHPQRGPQTLSEGDPTRTTNMWSETGDATARRALY